MLLTPVKKHLNLHDFVYCLFPQSGFHRYRLQSYLVYFFLQGVQQMDHRAALFRQCFDYLPKLLQGGTQEQLKFFQEWMCAVERREITLRQAQKVYAALTSQKTLVQPKYGLSLIRTSVAMLLARMSTCQKLKRRVTIPLKCFRRSPLRPTMPKDAPPFAACS